MSFWRSGFRIPMTWRSMELTVVAGNGRAQIVQRTLPTPAAAAVPGEGVFRASMRVRRSSSGSLSSKPGFYPVAVGLRPILPPCLFNAEDAEGRRGRRGRRGDNSSHFEILAHAR